ncbi:hypothetical protein K432DRAFT_253235, partial [Lepidopterella palustris CBS 459.81]
MAQGLIKKSAKPSKKPSTTSSGPKRGHRIIKPKKTKLIQKQAIAKKGSAGLSAMTEKHLAAKAGHLELLKGGKRE